MTKEEKEALFNRIHSAYTAAIHDYNKNNDFKRMREATIIFQEFITLFEELINMTTEETEYIKSLSFRNIEKENE